MDYPASRLFAEMMREFDLSDDYGHYLDAVGGATLAEVNLMSGSRPAPPRTAPARSHTTDTRCRTRYHLQTDDNAIAATVIPAARARRAQVARKVMATPFMQ